MWPQVDLQCPVDGWICRICPWLEYKWRSLSPQQLAVVFTWLFGASTVLSIFLMEGMTLKMKMKRRRNDSCLFCCGCLCVCCPNLDVQNIATNHYSFFGFNFSSKHVVLPDLVSSSSRIQYTLFIPYMPLMWQSMTECLSWDYLKIVNAIFLKKVK